jgi:hypothetical protein
MCFFVAHLLLYFADTDTESCIAALLDTSVRHAPHFDWVVAHIGSCFPHTVISRVLSVGLKVRPWKKEGNMERTWIQTVTLS